ncbi:MAG: YdcF family protein [Actinomycetes bacterium]
MSAPTLASPDARGARISRAGSVLVVPRTVRGVGTATVTLAVAISLLLPIGAVLQIVLTGQMDDRTTTQAIVVLDPAHYWGDPAPVLRARIEHAADLYRSGVAPVVVVTGPARSAAAARAGLVASGVPDRDVIAFATGADTVGSLEIVAGVMRDLGWSAATVVTDPAHSARAQATATALGMDAHMSPTEQGAGSTLTSEYVGRETVALLRYYLLTRPSLPQIVHAS